MGKFSKIFKHIESKDLRNKYEQNKAAKIEEEKKKEDTKKYISSAMEQVKYNWRSKIDVGETLREGMTTSDVATISSPANPDEVLNDTPLDNADDFAPGARGDVADFYDGTVGTSIKSGGSGSGNNGGFDIGNHLAFDGDGSTDGARWMITKPIDTTNMDHIVMSIITGNDSNGGETPDDAFEGLRLYYKTPEMNDFIPINYFPTLTGSDYRGGDIGYPDLEKLASTVDGPTFVDSIIIPVGGGSPTLQDYSKYIPSYARGKDTQFLLYQFQSSGTGKDNYGVKNISYRRKYPIQVVAPLDNPEASSFIRGAEQGSTPKKRKKDVDDKLTASDEYTTFKFGNEFPGQEVRVGGEDPFKGAKIGDDVEPSPQSKDEVKKSFTDFQKGDERVEVIKTQEKIQAENDQYFEDLNNLLAENEYDYTDPQVLEISDKILKNDPKNIDAYYYKSAYYDVSGDIEGARKVVDEMVKNNPDSPDGYALRSFYRQEAGDLAGAIEDLEKTLELEPDSEYVAYMEMELADLKFQKAEEETNEAIKDRMESEAGAIEAKAHEDYWNNADLLEQEQPIEYQGDNTTAIDDLGSVFLLRGKLANLDGTSVGDRGKSYEENLAAYNQVLPQIRRKAVDYITNLDTNQFKPESGSDYYVMTYKQQTMDSADEFAKYYATEFEDSEGDPRVYKFYYDTGIRIYKGGFGQGTANSVYSKGGAYAISNIQSMTKDQIIYQFESLLRQHSGKYGLVNDTSGNSYNKNIRETTKRAMGDYLKELAKNLPDDYFDSTEIANPTTLYDQMKALYDEEDPEKEIKTELNELGFDKQYKDLMSAWDSADKFSKFLTPLANLSKAFGDTLGKIGKALDDSVTAGANNAQLENYKIAIAKSVLLNRPIRVDPTTISTTLKQKLAMGISPNMISTFDVENPIYDDLKEFKQDGVGKYDYIQENPDYEGTGMGVIPIVREPKPYADFNIYTDKSGRVFKQDRSATGEPTVPNTTFQTDKSFQSGFMQGALASITRQNPLASRGQAQYQIVVPPDGSEPYLLYEDHAYYNIDSEDPGEAPGLSDAAAKFVNWLGNTAYKRNDGDANTGGMAGYPPNIRGDVITKFRINASDLPRGVREAIYRHPFLSENPGISQAIEDKLYNERQIKTMLGSKGLHNHYMNRQRLANTFRDFAVDKSIELIMGLPSIEGTKHDLRSASNMLQKYDDYIQATVFQPDGKTYIPGVVDADGNVQSRIDVTDQFTKNDQNHLKGMMFDDEALQILLKQYVNGKMSKKVIGGHIQDQFDNILSANSKYYRKVLANSLGKGTKVDIDQFLNGKLVIEKNYEFRDETVNSNWVVETVANMFDVSTDTAAAGGFFTSLATMTAARHLLNPVRGPGVLPGLKQTFRQAMNSAPTMPYKLEFDLSEKMMNILNAEPEDDISKDRFVDGEFIPGGWPTPSDLGSAGEIGGVDATSAATAAATTKKKKKPKGKVNESNLYERLKKRPFFNQDDIKPEFPENPPPKLDPKTGMHPEYGKKANRYKKLDPISANSMPPTGDPEIDAVVNKQKTINKIKKMTKKA